MDVEPDIDDKKVADIDREGAFMEPQRVSLVTQYVLDHFNQKTYADYYHGYTDDRDSDSSNHLPLRYYIVISLKMERGK